jgi:hypothetical protein
LRWSIEGRGQLAMCWQIGQIAPASSSNAAARRSRTWRASTPSLSATLEFWSVSTLEK